MPDPTEPETDPALTSLTCDWGGCEYTAKFWRFDPENGWLPVCFAEALVADWKAKTDAATQGPWEARTSEATMNDRSEWRIGRPDMPQVARSVMQAADAAFIAVSRTAVPRLLAAVESVLALHKPETRYTAAGWEEVSFESRVDAAEYGDTDDVQEFTVCHECGLIETHDGGEERCYEYSIWPCATVRAIESALGGDDDE